MLANLSLTIIGEHNMPNVNYKSKSNKNVIPTLLACIAFILAVFSYTIITKKKHVTAMDSQQYHQAIDKYMTSDSYH